MMKPGPKLDELLARTIMREFADTHFEDGPWWKTIGDNLLADWHPSTDIALAWKMIELLRPRLCAFSIYGRDNGYECFVHLREPIVKTMVGTGSFTVHAKTAPHAISLAILKAYGVNITR